MRFVISLLMVAVLQTGHFVPALGQGADATLLQTARWQQRLLVLCSPLEGDRVKQQFSTVDWIGFHERRLSLVALSADGQQVWSSDAEGKVAEMCELGQRPDADMLARTGCDLSSGGISLIGLDGGVKARWYTPVSNAELFGLIDAMPMRAREMRQE